MPVSRSPDFLNGHFPGDKRMVRIVVFPFAVASGQGDAVQQQPFADRLHVLLAALIVDHVGVGDIDLVGGDNLILC